jgi:hypothetical protein
VPPEGTLPGVAALELTRSEIDAQQVLDAAARARVLFPGPPSGGMSWTATSFAVGAPPRQTSSD